ncbi:39S ribosomal protein L12, mitochondrial [Anopheles nili]|uniref:39S ribosomal protein L12, mitochondrial n=1 Tax=Anopheles nili TaxID=185578 RepID=UPI00237A6727|nr:39S ribosomal protein L12, mitochondrial [Anopheles nili]
MFAVRTTFQLGRLGSFSRQIATNAARNAEAVAATMGAEKMTMPVPEGTEKPADPKLVSIVDSIARLNLLEVSELSTLLKRKLNLPDTAMMPAGFGAFAGGAAAPAAVADEEEAAPKVVKTTFKVKLVKYDEKQKVALIKEVKNLLEGMNLVQAKKFVESTPTIVKDDVPKEEAEKLKEAFTKVGAVVEIE